MVLPLDSRSLPCFSFLEGPAVRFEERGCIGTPGHYRRILLHVRFIARQVQHRVVFGETQDLPRLPRLAARSHSRTLGLG
jgi:hypothetical protein